jgi:sec-independent protein translocase protein TatC
MNANVDPPDEVEASRAPLLDHLIELRSRLIRSVIAIFVAFLVCFFFAKDIYNLLVLPYVWAAGPDAPVKLIYTAPQEALLTNVKLAFFGAVFFAFPIIANQIYGFVAPGLYKNERKAFLPYLIATPVLFVLGGALVYFMVMPLAMHFFLTFQQSGGTGQAAIEMLPKVNEYLSLITALILAFGIVFQLPVAMTLLAQAGLLTSETLRGKRRWAIVLSFVVAAVLTPPDPLSQVSLAIPTVLLYEISIFAVRWVERQRNAKEAEDAKKA